MGMFVDTIMIDIDIMESTWTLSDYLNVVLLKYDGKIQNLYVEVESI